MSKDDSSAPIFDMQASLATVSLPFRSRGQRGKRQKALVAATAPVDGRTLRATGRTEHLNFKAKPAIKAAFDAHVGHGNKSLWLEEAIISKLKDEGIEIEP